MPERVCHLCQTPLMLVNGFWACPTHTLTLRINGQVLYRALPKQWEYHTAKEPWVLFGGAAGGTKSHGGRWDLILAGLEAPGMPMLLLRSNLTELRNTHILTESGTGLAQLPAALGIWKATEKQFVLPNGAYIQCGYCENEADFQQYLSTAWGRVFLDEGSQFTPWMVEMLDSRIRSAQGYRTRFGIGSNPGGPLHEFLKGCFLTKTGRRDGSGYDPAQYRFIPAKLADNPYYGDDYRQKLDRLPPLERAMYLEGSWDLPMGNLFAELAPVTHFLPAGLTPWPGSRRVVCADWGWTALAPAIWVETDKGLHGAPFSRAYREWVPSQTVPSAWAEEVVRLSGEEQVEVVILDSAAFDPKQDGGPTVAEQMMPVFRRAGIRLLPAVKGPGSIARGVQLLHTYFWTNEGQFRPLLTISQDCPRTWEALNTIQRGDATKHQDVDLPAPHSTQLHIVDSLRYWASSRPRVADLTLADRLEADETFKKALTDDATLHNLQRVRMAEALQRGEHIPPKAPPLVFPKQTRQPWKRSR